MKSKFWLFFASLFVLTLSSCDNDDEDPITYSPPGVYSGTYTVDQTPGQAPLPFSLFVESDGTVVTESKGANGSWYYSSGTWTLSGDSLKTSMSTVNFPNVTVQQNQKFLFTRSTGQISGGTWKDIVNGTNSGSFQNMTRND
jgi:hypothetical protein